MKNLCGIGAVMVLLLTAGAWAQPARGRGEDRWEPPRERQGQEMDRPHRGPEAPKDPAKGPGDRGRFGPEGPGFGAEPGDEEIRRLVQLAQVVKLSKRLELDEGETVVLARRMEELGNELQELGEQRRIALMELRELVEIDADEERFAHALERMHDLDRQIGEVRVDAVHRVGEGMNMRQKAELYVFMQDFRQELRGMVRRAMQHRRGPAEDRPFDREAGPEHRNERARPQGPRPNLGPYREGPGGGEGMDRPRGGGGGQMPQREADRPPQRRN